ncbi:hypothetical protein [Noviherbaspirillum malthae]|uniref:hypothetical protein n=1 Tax=Noviherbaspirillum malthae TaxID=1260987 RepID=UPI00188E76FF|nr:hypothetical protein [Noviherbaspirillum malthae]
MRSRLFSPAGVVLVIHSPAMDSLHALPDKKSIDLICHVMPWDWYKKRGKPLSRDNPTLWRQRFALTNQCGTPLDRLDIPDKPDRNKMR